MYAYVVHTSIPYLSFKPNIRDSGQISAQHDEHESVPAVDASAVKMMRYVSPASLGYVLGNVCSEERRRGDGHSIAIALNCTYIYTYINTTYMNS